MSRKPGPIRQLYDRIVQMSRFSVGVLSPEQVADFLDAWGEIQNGPKPSTDDGPPGSKTIQ